MPLFAAAIRTSSNAPRLQEAYATIAGLDDSLYDDNYFDRWTATILAGCP